MVADKQRLLFCSAGTTGIFEAQYPNLFVTWERAHKYNFGIEFGLWNGLLNGNIDFFHEKRNNILTQYLSRPQWVGVALAAGNLGETKNSGYEIELKHANHIGNDFNYSVGLTYSHASNEIVSMDEPAQRRTIANAKDTPSTNISAWYATALSHRQTSMAATCPFLPLAP